MLSILNLIIWLIIGVATFISKNDGEPTMFWLTWFCLIISLIRVAFDQKTKIGEKRQIFCAK